MRSPVSRRAQGEWNAIRSLRFVHSESTSVGIMETGFGTSHKPFSGQPVNSGDSLETRTFFVTNRPFDA